MVADFLMVVLLFLVHFVTVQKGDSLGCVDGGHVQEQIVQEVLQSGSGDDHHLGGLRGLDLTDVQGVVVQAADLLRHQPGYGERRALAQPGGKIPDGQGSGGDGGVVRFRSAAAKQRRRQSRCQYDFPKLHGAKILSG